MLESMNTRLQKTSERRTAFPIRSLPIVLTTLLASLTFGNASAEVVGFAATESADPATSIHAVSLTPDQMHAAAAAFLPRMNQETLSLRSQLNQARKQRDIVKILCLEDKVKQADLVMNSAKDRTASLEYATKRGDLERARHDFTVFEALRERMRTVSMEASQCVGEELGFIDDAKVVVQVDPAVTPLDPTRLPPDPIFSEPPTVSSPTR